ncbi:hypothetical protein PtB15_17B24 [Puccinia triticina]|nr:hypothetical protein PtB15_17B24 [Puccinia triticina]
MVERISNRRNQAPPPPPTSIAAPAPQDEWADENLNIYEAGEQENHADQTMRPAQPSSYVSDYARRRDQLVTAWKQLENSMTAAYFTCQHHTRNWTTSQMYLLPLTECTCAPQLVTTRELDLIHTHDRLLGQSFTFCKCIPDPIRLLHYGYIAASPTTPRTAFAIPTLQLYQSLWYESSLPYTSFIVGLSFHQDKRSQQKLKARGRRGTSRQLRLPFSQALDIYNRIQILRTEILGKTLGLTTQDRWAATCPSCFGPEAADEKGSNDEVYAIIAMDGNFQHRHHRYASKDVPMEADYPSNFIPPSQIDGHQQNEETTANNAQGLEHDTDWATERIEPILADPILNSLVNEDQLSFIKGILYTAFLEITSLQLVWEKDMTKIIQQTGPYENDDQLMDDWSNQVTRIAFLEQSGCLSMIEGDFDNTLGESWRQMDQVTMRYFLDASANAATTNNQEEQADEDDGTENVIGDEEEFERALEEEDLNAAFADSIHLR